MSKKTTTDLAVSKPKGALAVMSEEMRAEAKAGSATFATGSPRISFKGGRITIDKEPVKDNKLPVAVIDTVLHKAYYDKEYEEGSPAAPVCYAFHADDPAALIPHKAAPQPQAGDCKSCPHNKFGTARVGKGKACRDLIRVMAVVPSDDDFTGAEARSFDVGGHSIKTWNDYTSKLKTFERDPKTVITEVSTEPHGGAFRLTFTHAGDLTVEQYRALKARREVAREQMMQPYPVIEEETEEAPAPKAKPKGRKF